MAIICPDVAITTHTHTHTHTHIYIYIYIYLQTNNLPAFTVTRKKEKKCQELKIIISRISARGEKERNIIGQKKKRLTSSHLLKKIKRYAISWSKEKEKPTVNCCNATITKSAQYKVEPITKIKSRVGFNPTRDLIF